MLSELQPNPKSLDAIGDRGNDNEYNRNFRDKTDKKTAYSRE